MEDTKDYIPLPSDSKIDQNENDLLKEEILIADDVENVVLRKKRNPCQWFRKYFLEGLFSLSFLKKLEVF